MAQNLGEVSQLTAKKFRVLLAEGDSSETASSLRALFPEPSALELSAVTSFSTLIPTIELTHPEVVFFDLSLGPPDPLSAARHLHRSAPGVPLIVIADAKEKDYASLSLTEGAIDYLFRGYIDPPTLERVLRSAMEHNTLEGLADLLRDPVTGLYNRDGFVTLGGRALDMAMRSGSTLVLLCAQIENLSALQEEFGPGAKEQAAREAAGLPAAAANASEETVPHAPAPSLAEMRGTETLLLAEDHESIREMARQALVNLGYRVLSAADGEEALRLCQTERPALAILDVVMPKVGGLAAAERLAARFENLPILFTSGYSQDCQGMEPVSASGRYLQKPYSPMSLGRVVREIVDKS